MSTRLSLLGGAVIGDHATGEALPADRRGCLLAHLAVEGGWVERDRLALLFWPDSDESGAKRNLRQLLLRARRLAPDDPPLDVSPDAIRWRVASDVGEFRYALANGNAEEALAVYRGRFLHGFAVPDAGGVNAWIEGERESLHAAYHEVCLRTARAATAGGRYGAASQHLAKLLSFDPLAEEVVAAYMQALYLDGRRDAALHTYERFADYLDVELGLAPLDATSALVERIRRGEPLALAEVPRVGAGARAWPLQPTRLAGRDEARNALLSATANVVLVKGEPGVGKSALLNELLPWPLKCEAHEGLEHLPYHPLAELVRNHTEFAAGLGPYLEDLARLVPEVASGLVPPPVEPGAARGRLVQAFFRFVAAGGGIIVVDDLQWADPATIETLVFCAGHGTRVYGSYRTGEMGSDLAGAIAALRNGGGLVEVSLEPLSAAGVQALIGDLMQHPAGPPVFSHLLWERTGGNPMFVLETVRSLFEAGVLRADASGWHTDVDDITVDYSEVEVPAAVTEVIQRRLGRLSGPTIRVLEVLALARSRLGTNQVALITGLTPAAVADAIDEADDAGFLAGGGFRHDLLRQTLDQRVEPAKRELLHALMAEALSDTVDVGVVAEHWHAAGEREKAAAAWLEKANAMRARGMHEDAVSVLEAAISRLAPGETVDGLRLALVDTLRESGRSDDALALLEAVEAAAHQSPALRLRAALARGWLTLNRGSVGAAAAIQAEAISLAAVVDDPELRLDLLMQRAAVAKELQRTDEAIHLLEPAAAELRTRRPSLRLVQFLTSLAALHDDRGQHDLALPLHLEALDLARALGSRYHQVEATINLLYCLADLGRHDEAVTYAERALELGDYDNVPILRVNLAVNHFQAGRFEEALRHYDVLTLQQDQPHLRLIALARSAECQAALGRAVEVGGLLEEALALLFSTDYVIAHGAVAIAVVLLGDEHHVARLWEALSPPYLETLPQYMRQRLDSAMVARAGRTGRPDDGGRPS